MMHADMRSTIDALVVPGKGLLAADESLSSIAKRFQPFGIESTEETRRQYRQMFFTTPGVGRYISGAILFDETLRQRADDGRPFVKVLNDNGVVPGIKVDAGTVPLAGAPDERITEGLDGLRQRLEEYRSLGARFTKWRAVITIGDAMPSSYCLETNAHTLARYAALCQEAGLVPIVEPEVLMDGSHRLERTFEVTEATLARVFAALREQRVVLEHLLLKPNMVVPGARSDQQASVREAAEATVRCLRRTVPAAVPGVVFLSGGQDPQTASAHLNASRRSFIVPAATPQPVLGSTRPGWRSNRRRRRTWLPLWARGEKSQAALMRRSATRSIFGCSHTAPLRRLAHRLNRTIVAPTPAARDDR